MIGQVGEQSGTWGRDKGTDEHQSTHNVRSLERCLQSPSCGLRRPDNKGWSGIQMLDQRQHIGTKRRVGVIRPVGARFALSTYIHRHDTVPCGNKQRCQKAIFGAQVTPGGHTKNQKALALIIKSNRSITQFQVLCLHSCSFLEQVYSEKTSI